MCIRDSFLFLVWLQTITNSDYSIRCLLYTSFEAAQAAADQYVRCTKDSLTIAERTLAAAKRQADTLVQEARAQAQKRLADADAHLESSWSQFLLEDSGLLYTSRCV